MDLVATSSPPDTRGISGIEDLPIPVRISLAMICAIVLVVGFKIVAGLAREFRKPVTWRKTL